jgi:hypothetical protein
VAQLCVQSPQTLCVLCSAELLPLQLQRSFVVCINLSALCVLCVRIKSTSDTPY